MDLDGALQRTARAFDLGHCSDFEEVIKTLQQAIAATRPSTIGKSDAKQLIHQCSKVLAAYDLQSDLQCLRLLRGVVLLARNAASVSAIDTDAGAVMYAFGQFTRVEADSAMLDKCQVAFVELMANLASAADINFGKSIVLVRTPPKIADPVTVPLLTLVARSTRHMDPVQHDNVLLFVCRCMETEDARVLTLSTRILTDVMQHPAFAEWISKSDEFALEVVAFILTTEDWSDEKSGALTYWLIPLVLDLVPKVTLAIDLAQNLIQFHRNALLLFEMLAKVTLSKDARGKLLASGALTILVNLLRSIHTHIQPQLLKKTTLLAERLPMVRCLIVETLTNLVHDSPQVRDELRELHALELILSSCVIDDDNPFLKERAILCLRYCLKGSSANQQFVAQLEAIKTQDDLVLHEVGYKAEVSNGKVQLRPIS